MKVFLTTLLETLRFNNLKLRLYSFASIIFQCLNQESSTNNFQSRVFRIVVRIKQPSNQKMYLSLNAYQLCGVISSQIDIAKYVSHGTDDHG